MSWRGLFPVYAPLFVLAAASFWLAPGEKLVSSPDYAVALHEARYTRASPTGALHLAAGRMEYENGVAQLFALRLSQQIADSGRLVLHGESGEARRGEAETRQFTIHKVRGEIEGGGRLLTLRAESVFYDTADGGLSGRSPHIVGGGGELRGEEFTWHADSGWKVKGNVEGIYWR